MNRYKLVGFLNMFNIVPDFVYPIFEQSGQFYFQSGAYDKIDNFVPVKCEMYPRISHIEYKGPQMTRKGHVITKDSKPLYAFQIGKNNFIFGNSRQMLGFFSKYIPHNPILKEQIEDFRKEIGYKSIITYKTKTPSVKGFQTYRGNIRNEILITSPLLNDKFEKTLGVRKRMDWMQVGAFYNVGHDMYAIIDSETQIKASLDMKLSAIKKEMEVVDIDSRKVSPHIKRNLKVASKKKERV